MNWRRFALRCSALFLLAFLFPGQSFHLWFIMEPFVEGEIVTQIEEEVLERFNPVGFNFCVLQKNFTTILEAWYQTPSEAEVLVNLKGKCGFVSCNKLVVRKYFYNNYICYVIEYINRAVSFHRRTILAKYSGKSMIKYQINLKKFLSDEFVLFMADYKQPAIKYFEGEKFKMSRSDISGKSFTLHSHSETRIRLPGYKGQCIDYNKLPCGDPWLCYMQCINNFTSTLNVSIAADTIYEPVNQTLLNVVELPTETRNFVNDAYRYCHEKYPDRPCESQTYYTDIHVDTTPVPDGQVLFSLELSTKPDKIISDVARLSVTEMITQVLSSLGFWFSFGLLDFLPIKLFDHLSQAENRQKIYEVLESIVIIIVIILSCLKFIFFDLPIRFLVKAIIWCQDAYNPPPVNANPDAVVPFENDPHPFAIA